jgi:two-component system nitrate/nitrite response regulator NarL
MRDIVHTYIISSTDLICSGICATLQESRFRVAGSGKRFFELKIPTKQLLSTIFIISVNENTVGLEEDVRQIRELAPKCHIVLLLSSGAIGDPMSLVQLGASGCLADSISADAFLKSLDVVVTGGVVLPSQVLREFFVPAKQVSSTEINDTFTAEKAVLEVAPSVEGVPHYVSEAPNLSDRETVILGMLVKGESNKLIARGLNIAEATVKVHVKAILRKIRARNRTQAAIWALQNGGQPLQRSPVMPAETHFAHAGE